MAIVRFSADQFDKVIEETLNAKKRIPFIDDLFDPKLYRAKQPVDEKGRTKRQCLQDGIPFWPDPERVMVARLKPALQLTVDQGVYVLSNAVFEQGEAPTVVYADHCNPYTDPDWESVQREVFGESVANIRIPIEWFDDFLDEYPDADKFELEITDDGVQVYL